MTITVSPITGHIGALVEGLDLTKEIPAPDFAQLHKALLAHKVVFLRGQHITDEQQERFSRLFGDQVPHPTVPSIANSAAILDIDASRSRANSWHTDVTFAVDYPKISILRSVVVPKHGGDTVWANTVKAYEELPEVLKKLADRLWARHSNLYDYATAKDIPEETRQQYRSQFAAEVYETDHPLVRVHPETGERALVLGHFVGHILDVSANDSKLLFKLFHDRVIQLENTVRWRWQEGDIAIWDNRATEHIAINDYGDEKRILKRTTIAGEVPVGVDGQRSRAIKPHADARSPRTEQDKQYLYERAS